MCNNLQIFEPNFCYVCKCEKCSTSNDEDRLCMSPSIHTPRIPIEGDETCILTSWEVNYKYKYINRGIGSDLTKCWYNSHQPEQKYDDVICKTCNEDRCNGDNAYPKRRATCYDCECFDCNAEKSSACIKPGTLTKSTEPLRETDFCVLFVSAKKNGEVYIRRLKTCEPDFCESKFKAKPKDVRLMCILCRKDKCNGMDRHDILLQIPYLFGSKNETAESMDNCESVS